MKRHVEAGTCFREHVDNRGTNGSIEPDVRHQPAPEKRGDALARAVNELCGQRHVRRVEILTQRAHRAHRDDSLHTELFEPVDVGAKIDLRGSDHVAAPMAGKERNLPPLERPDNVGVRRFSKGRRDPHFASLFQTRHIVKTTATDDSNLCFGQTSSSAPAGRDSSN